MYCCWNISWYSSEIESGIFLLVWYCVSSGTRIFDDIGSTLRFGEVWLFTLGTRGISETTLRTREFNCSTLGNWLPCCGRWISSICTAPFEILIVLWWQLVQVIQRLMVIPVLGFLVHGSVVMLQLLIHLMRRFWACQNGEGRSQLCLKFFRLLGLSFKIWIIYSVMVLWQCNIHLIHEYHMLLSFQVCHEPGFLFLVVQMVCNWSWRFQIVFHEQIDLDWFWICAWYSEWLLVDPRVYPKVVMGNLDWHCTTL